MDLVGAGGRKGGAEGRERERGDKQGLGVGFQRESRVKAACVYIYICIHVYTYICILRRTYHVGKEHVQPHHEDAAWG